MFVETKAGEKYLQEKSHLSPCSHGILLAGFGVKHLKGRCFQLVKATWFRVKRAQ